MRFQVLAVAVLAVGLVGAAPAHKQRYIGPGDDPKAKAYLTPAQAPDTLRILPPAPVAGTARYAADRTTFLETRWLQDSPRWALAQADNNEAKTLADLSCAVGVDLTGQPKLTALLKRARWDVRNAGEAPKDHYARKRPYLIDKGPTCFAPDAGLSANGDYPSGHTTWGWAVGLLLAELAPDRATDILIRARSFGESRIVCGVHNLSAIEAGRTNASVVVAALHGSAEFRKDLEAVRKEVAAARKAGPAPDAAACKGQAEIYETAPY